MPASCQLPKAKLMALEVNKKQWGIGADGGAAAVTASAMCNQHQHITKPMLVIASNHGNADGI